MNAIFSKVNHPSRGVRRRLAGLLAVGGSIFLASCVPGEDPGLTERMAEMRAAMDAKDREIAALKVEVEQARLATAQAAQQAPPPRVEPRLKPLQEVETDYANEVLAYRSRLESGLDGFSLDGVTLHRVDASGAEHAYRTQMSLRMKEEASGNVMDVTLPITADILGRWKFPEPAEVVASAKEYAERGAAMAVAPPAAGPVNPTGAVATGEQTSGLMQDRLAQGQVVAETNPTIVVVWADGAREPQQQPQAQPQQPQAQQPQQPQAQVQQPAAPPQPQQPQAPAGPGPMRSDEEVKIEF